MSEGGSYQRGTKEDLGAMSCQVELRRFGYCLRLGGGDSYLKVDFLIKRICKEALIVK